MRTGLNGLTYVGYSAACVPSGTLGTRPESRSLRQPRGGEDVAEPAERRVGIDHQILDVLCLQLGRAPTFHATERVDPAPSLGERHPHEITPAFARAASERDQCSERSEIPGAVIDDLSGEMFRVIEAAAEPVLVGHAGGRLDQRFEPSPLAPRPGVAIRRQRDVLDAGAEMCHAIVARCYRPRGRPRAADGRIRNTARRRYGRPTTLASPPRPSALCRC